MMGAVGRARLCCSRYRPRDTDAYGGKGVIHAGAPIIREYFYIGGCTGLRELRDNAGQRP